MLLPLLAKAFKPAEPAAEGDGEGEGDGEAVTAAAPAEAEATEGDETAVPSESDAVPAAEEEEDKSRTGVIEIGIEGDEGAEDVFNTLVALLPEPRVEPEDKDKVPVDEIFQLVRKPFPRANRRAVRCPEILRMDPVDPEEEARKEAEAKKEEAAAAAAAAAKARRVLVGRA